ncbi:MAG: TlpA family protein disulfide reductase [Chitinophagaceae bacterium]|nr:TlpA family protein disulfide reductase [Chitinophagaceae bacterium]
MHLRLLLICGLCLGRLNMAQAQAKYYQARDGKIYDEQGFVKAKEMMLQPFKDLGNQMTVQETMAEIRRSGDSIVYQVDLLVKYSESNIPQNVGFKEGAYLNKPWVMPGLKTMEGRSFNMDALRGKPVLLNFWFIKCPPCVEEMPVLNRFRQAFGDSIHFVAVTFESKKDVQQFLEKHRFDFQHITDARAFTDSIGMTLFPRNIFIDREGIVRRIENGVPFERNNAGKLVMGSGKDFEVYLRELLK